MILSQAPYKFTTESFSQYFVDYDRQNQRLIAKMWDVLNRKPDAPIFGIYTLMSETMESSTESQLWLLLQKFSLPEWFVRIVNSTIMWSSTNNGRCRVDTFMKDKVFGLVAVREALDAYDARESNKLAHECTNKCRQMDHHIFFGQSLFCHYGEQSDFRKTAVYATLTWLLTEDGQEFTNRHRKAYARLMEFRKIEEKNITWRSGKK